MSEVETHSGQEIEQYAESLVISFFTNNSRLVLFATENESTHDLFAGTKEFKEGTVSIKKWEYSIYGYCLGTYVEITHSAIDPGLIRFHASNIPPLVGIIDSELFSLNSTVQIEYDRSGKIHTSQNKEHSLNYLKGSLLLFKKWHDNALNKRFPMSKNKNPLTRFFY